MARGPISGVLRRQLLAAAAAATCLLPALRSEAAGPAPQGDEFRVNTLTEATQQSASVARATGGAFVVAWQSEVAGSGDEIRAQRFDASGAAQGAEIAVNTLTASSQNVPVVAMDARGDFVVAWQSLIAGNFAIRARCFDARGVPRGAEIAVSSARGESQSAPSVAMDADGDFVVVWERPLRGSYEIRARRFAVSGVAQGPEIAINTVTASAQRVPSVALDADGDFVVAWRSNVAGSFEIRARRFGADGVARGDEIAVNALTTGDQLAPCVAADADGDFVVAWESALEDSYEIRARRFRADGAARGAEFAVHPATAGNQFSPAIALDAGGDFVVAWHSLVDGSYEIRARSFAASGAAQSAELAVNLLTAASQKSASVALGADGDFLVAWHSDATGSWEIAARRYEAPPRRGRTRAEPRAAAK